LLQIWQSGYSGDLDLDLDLENIPPSLRERLARLSRENKELKSKVSHSKPKPKLLVDLDPSIMKQNFYQSVVYT
jgi:hypothetical protein